MSRKLWVIQGLCVLGIFIFFVHWLKLARKKKIGVQDISSDDSTLTHNMKEPSLPSANSGFHNLFRDRHQKFRVVTYHPTTDEERVYYTQTRTEVVNPFRYEFIKTSPGLCDIDTFMIILIFSIHEHIEHRNAIRQTWGSIAKGHAWPNRTITEKIRLGFIFGMSDNKAQETALNEESQRYGDVIQGNFADTYGNLTLKSRLALSYIWQYCTSATYYLKADEDVFVNIPYLLHILKLRQPHRSIMGAFMGHAPVIRGAKSGDRSWGVPREVFPLKMFPFYAAGQAYLITTDIVKELYDMSAYVAQVDVEDAYITGILAAIIGAHHAVQTGFSYQYEHRPSSCLIIRDQIITATNMITESLQTVWRELEGEARC